MVFEIRLLKTTLGLKMQEVTGEWRELYIDERRNLLPRQMLLVCSNN
jgi:hypothetical protein